jgi:ribonuclease BN (tRNA processing enzyme)
MRIKVLGCSGGIGFGLRTTSMLVDDDILIDAGSGVGDLTMDQLLLIDHIFITHSHLDHIAFIPLLLDTVMGFRVKPITLHATRETLAALRQHIFNWTIWPDFNAIPDNNKPFLQYTELSLDVTSEINGRKITALPVNHVVPAVGYHVQGDEYSLVYTGDTTVCDALWVALTKIHNLKYLIIETAFSNSEHALAKLSKHLCPAMLASELGKLAADTLAGQFAVYITHLKPGEDAVIMNEIAGMASGLTINQLRKDHIFNL